MAGCVVGRFGPVPESIPPFDRGSRPGLARCPQALFRGEEVGEGDSFLSGGETVWGANQD